VYNTKSSFCNLNFSKKKKFAKQLVYGPEFLPLLLYHDIKLLTWCRSKLVGKFGRQIRFYLTLDHEEMDIETSSTAI